LAAKTTVGRDSLPGQHTAKNEESARDNYVTLACNFAKYSPILIFFIRRLSNKPFLIWLLITPAPPHLKYAAVIPCNLPLRACFADIIVSHGNVATVR